MTPLTHPLKWPGSHRRLAPRIVAEAQDALDGRTPSAVIDCTVGGAGFMLEALPSWPDARVLLADTCQPLARLWLDLSRAAGAAEVEAVVAEEARKWSAGDDILTDDRARTRFELRRAWHHELRREWNADNLRHLAAHPLAELPAEVGRRHSGRFAALLRGAYKGLCRFSQRGTYNVGCGAELSDKAARPLYEAGAFAAIGVELERRRARVACASYRDVLPAITRFLKGALVYLDPPFPGGFTAYSPGCEAPPVAELADAAAFAASHGAAVVVSHPAELADEWRAHLPGAVIHTDLVRRGTMEPSPTAAKARKDRGELLVVLRAGGAS